MGPPCCKSFLDSRAARVLEIPGLGCNRGPGLGDLDVGAGVGELLLDLLGVVLRGAFLDRLGRFVDQGLGLLAQPSIQALLPHQFQSHS